MKTGFVLGGLAVAVLAVAVQREVKPQTTVERRFEGSDGRVIEGLGACAIDTDSVRCWNMDGAIESALTDRVRNYLQGPSNDLQFSFGRKNRWLVVRQSPSYGANFENPKGGYLPSSQFAYHSNEDSQSLLRIAVDPQETSAAIVATYYVENRGKAPKILFEAGKSTTEHGVTFEFGAPKAIKKADIPTNLPSNGPASPWTNGKVWSVPVGQTSADGEAVGTYSFTPLDSSGGVIGYVDKNGQPVSHVRVLESADLKQQPWNGQVSSKDYSPAQFIATNSQFPDAAVYFTNIDPKKIAALRLGVPAVPCRVQITGFPLDPAK